MRCIAFLTLVLVSSATFSTTYTHEGFVYRVGSIPSRSDGDFIVVEGFVDAGSCPIGQGGYVGAKVQDSESGSRAFSIALSAKISGTKIKITVDDSNKNANGYCYIHSLEIKD